MRFGKYLARSFAIIATLYTGFLILITLSNKEPEEMLMRKGLKAGLIEVNQSSSSMYKELDKRFAERRQHVRKACEKHGLQKPNKNYKANAWEFLVNKEHGLVWCNIFKAASSTWFYNFNLLAGYTKKHLAKSKNTPVQLARKYYNRPSVDELLEILHGESRPLAFLITRHPLERLVSYYRNKFFDRRADSHIKKLCKTITSQYPKLPVVQSDGCGRMTPSFVQFAFYVVDYFTPQVLESMGTGVGNAQLDMHSMHWVPMNSFCTPCLVDFDVYAKVETMDEDGNYIIEKTGVSDVIKMAQINKSTDVKKRLEEADALICQLTEEVLLRLIDLYRYDVDLFQYDVTKYINCTRGR
ncbi:unnamed protein product [Meganyctiphanes norvegica]|uniref:Carbohydrate sulfotransferase n=1 Tax=Meganyctiphanes norvegica TaxID=48144 RepID=A0AAV2R7F8_MEGNR